MVVSFDDKFKAGTVLSNLLQLEQNRLVALEDAVVVIKNAEGKVRVKAYHDLVEPVAELGNELWGGIISAVIFHRTLTIAQGVFDPDFLTKVENSLQPNSSALFVLVQPADTEAVLALFSDVGGTVSKTRLPEAEQRKLQDALK